MKKLRDVILSFFRSEKSFFADVSFTFGGKLIGATIAILTTPIATRIFSPADYGEFAIYSSLVQNMVLVGGLALPIAIFSDKKEWVNKIATLLIQSYLFWGILFALGLFSFKENLDLRFDTQIFSKYWFLLIISYFLIASVGLLASLNIKEKRFKYNSFVNLSDIVVSKILNLSGGFSGLGGLSFMLGEIGGKLVALVLLIKKLPSDIDFRITSFKNARLTLVRHKEYPMYILPSQWVNLITNQLIIWFIAFQFDQQILGKYSLAVSLLNIPLTLLGSSFEPVISRKLVSIRDDNESPSFFNKILILLISLSVFCFVTVYFFPGYFYVFLLGAKWEGIEVLIKVLCWSYLAIMVDNSLHNCFVVFDRKKQKLLFNVFEIASQFTALFIANYLQFELIEALQIYVLVKVLVSIIRISYLWKLVKIKKHER